MPEEPFFAADPTELDIGFGTPRRQDRVTVAFRPLLVLPHVVALSVLTLVSLPLLIVGWFAALILGRLPRWIAVYEMSVIAYAIRASAYAFMLAGVFPPFSFSQGEFPVAVEIGASRLSRLKVFFRWLLVLPASIAAGWVGTGLFVLSPIVGLVTLARGRMPQPLFSAVAAVIRYQARINAYSCLVTDVYPRGLFGDDDWRSAPDRETRLPLSRGVKRLVALMLVAGIATPIASIVVMVELSARSFPSSPALVAAASRFEEALSSFEATKVQCRRGPEGLGCLESRTRLLGVATDRLVAAIARLPLRRMTSDQALASFGLILEAAGLERTLRRESRARTRSAFDKRFFGVLATAVVFQRDASSVGLHL